MFLVASDESVRMFVNADCIMHLELAYVIPQLHPQSVINSRP